MKIDKKDTGSKLVADCLRLLDLCQIFCWRNNTVGVYDAKKGCYRFHGMRGVADILGVLDYGGGAFGEHVFGRALAVECKSGTGRLSANQKHFRERFEAAGGCYIEAHSVDDVAKALRSWGLLA